MSSEAELDAARKLALDQLSPEERDALTEELSDEEQAALKVIADGGSDDDDDDDGDGTPAAAAAAVPAVAVAVIPAGDVADDDAPLPFKPQFKVDLPADLDDQLTALATQEAEIAQKMKDGEIEIADFMEKTKAIGKSVARLEGLRDQAATFDEMNKQTAEQEWQWTINQFKRSAKKLDGIDYNTNDQMDADLDSFVKAIASRPENMDKDYLWFLTEAHKRVKALHGAGEPQAAPKKDDPPKPRKAASAAGVPVTLAMVPGGDGPGDVGNDEFADVDKLDGLEYETALAKMSKEQRDRYLQAA